MTVISIRVNNLVTQRVIVLTVKMDAVRLTSVLARIVLCMGMATTCVGCGSFGGHTSASQHAEETFQAMIGVPVEPRIRLFTEAPRYRHEDNISIWVENGTAYTLRFTNETLGLRAYYYDNQTGGWRSVLVPLRAVDAHEVVLKPGERPLLPILMVPAEWIDASGAVRLVIVGTSAQGLAVAACKDIEISD
jgi:hypothetical protein